MYILKKSISLTTIFLLLSKFINAQSEHTFAITVPKDATVFVGEKDRSVDVLGVFLQTSYIPFVEKYAVYKVNDGENSIWYYNVTGTHNYRIKYPAGITQVGVFTPNANNIGAGTELVFTIEQLTAHNPKKLDRDVNSLNGRNVADVFININPQGHLILSPDATFQIINCRNWQAVDNDVNNYFIEPDFKYEVIKENGEPDNTVITVDDNGLITAIGEGTAIVLITYDAMVARHTTNVGNNGNAFFGAILPENTGVFVVTVGNTIDNNIDGRMFINRYWNDVDENEGVRIDAEHDVLYYEAENGSFDFTFTPTGVAEVYTAKPAISQNTLSFSGFDNDGVTANDDGSYTVSLYHGRNIIKLVSPSGNAIFQVISAKPVTYTVSNVTNPGENFLPGDEASIVFKTLYHPANKLSGIYNMSAGIQYTGEIVNLPLYLGPGQYAFASRAQEYKVTIPTDFRGNEFVLTNGVIRVTGFGSPFGAHRQITRQDGINLNFNADVRTVFSGSLPDIHLKMKDIVTTNNAVFSCETTNKTTLNVYPNPFVDHIVVETDRNDYATIYNILGQALIQTPVKTGKNHIETAVLPQGMYIVRVQTNYLIIYKH